MHWAPLFPPSAAPTFSGLFMRGRTGVVHSQQATKEYTTRSFVCLGLPRFSRQATRSSARRVRCQPSSPGLQECAEALQRANEGSRLAKTHDQSTFLTGCLPMCRGETRTGRQSLRVGNLGRPPSTGRVRDRPADYNSRIQCPHEQFCFLALGGLFAVTDDRSSKDVLANRARGAWPSRLAGW